MISDTTYLAAKMVSSTLEEYFSAYAYKHDLLPVNIIEAVMDAAFWSSLRKEEGHSPKISIALIPVNRAKHSLCFSSIVRLTPHALVKLSPAVIQPGVHLGVWYDDHNLFIWGTIHSIPDSCMVLEVVEPGLLVVKHKQHEGYGKFINVAILKGDQVKLVEEQNLGLTDYPDILGSLLGLPFLTEANEPVHILVELAVAMRRHGRGGLLLVVPSAGGQWQNSIVHPMGYVIDPIYCALADLMHTPLDNQPEKMKEQLLKIIDIIGGFTAIDGATIITKAYELLAFGVKVGRDMQNEQVSKVMVSEPIIGNDAIIVDPVKMGGTRHLAAAQFVHDQHDAMALVASQDGIFTVFTWSEPLQLVRAHRIDTLLL